MRWISESLSGGRCVGKAFKDHKYGELLIFSGFDRQLCYDKILIEQPPSQQVLSLSNIANRYCSTEVRRWVSRESRLSRPVTNLLHLVFFIDKIM